MHELAHEVIHYFTHADKGLFHLIRDLLIRSGSVAREFIEGRRKKYFSPINFFLIAAALNVFAMTINETYQQPDILKEHPEVAAISDPVKQQKFYRLYERQAESVFFIKKHSNLTVIFALPLIAFIFRLYYRRWKYNFTEHLIAAMYMYGLSTLIFVTLALLNVLTNISDSFVYALGILFMLVYFPVFYRRLIPGTGLVRPVLATITTLVSIFVVNGLAVFLYMVGLFGK